MYHLDLFSPLKELDIDGERRRRRNRNYINKIKLSRKKKYFPLFWLKLIVNKANKTSWIFRSKMEIWDGFYALLFPVSVVFIDKNGFQVFTVRDFLSDWYFKWDTDMWFYPGSSFCEERGWSREGNWWCEELVSYE